MPKIFKCGVLSYCVYITALAPTNAFAIEAPSDPTTASATPLLLRFKPEQGSRYSTQFDFSQEGTAVVMKMKIEFRQTISALYDTRVLQAEADGTTVRIYFRELKMQLSDGKWESSFDSLRHVQSLLRPVKPLKKGAPPSELADFYSPVMAAMVGQSITSKVSDYGKVLEIQGVEDLVKRVVPRRDLPSSFSEKMNTSVTRDLIRRIITGVGDQTLINGVYSGRPVPMGDTWTGTQITGGKAAAMQTETSFNFKSRQNGNVTIGLNGLSFDANTALQSSRTAYPQTSLSAQMKGALLVEERSGRIISASIEQRSYQHRDDGSNTAFAQTATYGKGTLSIRILDK